jgi:hypothetical protein
MVQHLILGQKSQNIFGKKVVEMAAIYRRMAYEQHITKQINHPAHKVLSTISNHEVWVAQSKQLNVSYKSYGPRLLKSSSFLITLDLLVKSLSCIVDSY